MLRARALLLARLLGVGVALAAALAPAIASADGEGEGGRLRVGTKETPPFVVRGPDGALAGPSLALWEDVAGDLGVTSTYEERDLAGLFRGLEDGTLDVAVAALTITAEREQRVDFTHPYHTSGLAIAVSRRPADDWVDVFVAVFTASFLRLVLAFAALQIVVGALMWLCERRRNPHFQGPAAAGLGAGLWWAVVTMATVGYGDKVPITGGGRLLAMIWMLVSLIILTTVTASISSSLTVGRLEAQVRGPEDLGKLRVAAVTGTTAEVTLREMKLDFVSYPGLADGLADLALGQIDAVVHDEPILQAEVDARHPATIEILPRTFQRQDYAFAVPTGSALREAINQSLARRVGGLAGRFSR